ncbi:helix-turn-helix domain-containing protein [Paraglaciecola arctica]|uniref:helix-turn-helix domain-containing protein n=1 Tax=Paraglaciecola arctica TaxID=1128911 RepID=UPI001C079F01|nr:helix-turn-helix domain-containing protein [Paraglaciecola arctica]MBU3005250.1 helix-turn-helix domain-containing protein [Paraglaciecola arctica]
MPFRVGVFVYDNCLASGTLGFSELLEAANKRINKPYFECVFVSHEGLDVELTLGHLSNLTMFTLNDIATANLDALLIPGFWTQSINDVYQFQQNNKPLILTLSRLEQQLEIYAYCTAVTLLAASGRLVGKTATATWWLSEYLCDTYKEVDWRFADTFVKSSQTITASGVQGYLPIANYLIQQHCGAEILDELTDLMVLPRPIKKPLPMQELQIIKSNGPLMAKVFRWVENSQASELKVENLAIATNMSKRTLARKITALSGLSCATFMRKVKIQQACNLLRLNRFPVKQVCFKLGYLDESSFRRIFKETTGYTPAQFTRYFVD